MKTDGTIYSLSDGEMKLLPFSISGKGYDGDGRLDRRGNEG